MMVTLAIAAAGFAVWTVRLGVVARAARRPPPPPLAEVAPVALIVPARDEAHNLPHLLGSIARLAPRPAELVVVDDCSSDGTGAIARAAGATVVSPDPLPPGWLGKPWACARGARAARADLLLFTDADTRHAPGSLGQAAALLEAEDADLVSALPTHLAVRPWEKLQGVFHLLLLVATRAAAPAPARGERDFCIGQYLLFRRAAYERLGGHAAVRDRVAEDLAFARLIRAGGGRTAVLVAPGALRVRMYPEGPGAFLRGWRRNFREGLASAGAAGVLELVLVIGWLLGAPLGLLGALATGADVPSLVLGGVVALTVAEVARRQRLVGELPAWAALCYPLFVLAFVAVSALALVDRVRRAPVAWRGRVVPR